MNKVLPVSKKLLENRFFDLVHWYQGKINSDNYYNLAYDQKMSELQKAILEVIRSESDPLTNLPEPSQQKGFIILSYERMKDKPKSHSIVLGGSRVC